MVPVLWSRVAHEGGRAFQHQQFNDHTILEPLLNASPLPDPVWGPEMNKTTTAVLQVLTIYWEEMTEKQMNTIKDTETCAMRTFKQRALEVQDGHLYALQCASFLWAPTSITMEKKVPWQPILILPITNNFLGCKKKNCNFFSDYKATTCWLENVKESSCPCSGNEELWSLCWGTAFWGNKSIPYLIKLL